MERLRRREFVALLGGAVPAAGAAQRAEVRLSIGTYGMKTVPTETALRAIAGIGFDGVELCLRQGWPADAARMTAGERSAIRRVLDETGLTVAAVMDDLVLRGTPQSRASNAERIKLAAGVTHELARGKPACMDTMLGLKTAEWESRKVAMAAELRGWAELAEREDFVIGVKPHAGQAMDTPEKAVWMMEQVASPRIRLIYDYSHMRVGGFGLAASLRKLLPYTAMITVKDAKGTPEHFEFLLPGDGDTDYKEYARLLGELGYRGFVNAEVSAMVFGKPGYDPMAAARVCYGRMAPVFAAIRRRG